MRYPIRFKARLFKYPGKGGWTFAPVPKEFAPDTKLSWGRTPVRARVNGVAWSASVWTGKSGETLLPVPGKVRGPMGAGDEVEIELEYLL
jgi:hypothetical protein